MENYTNYNTLSTEETCLLQNLIYKLSVSGLRQYNTPVATILFKKWFTLSDDGLLKEVSINAPINSQKIPESQIQEIKDDLRFIDDYVMEMQDMLKSKPIVTNLEKIRQYIDIIGTKVSKLE